MSIPTVTLRAYQDLNLAHVSRALTRHEKRHVLFAAPMASGKTIMGKALAAKLLGPLYTTIIIIAPSKNIVNVWRKPVQICNVERNWGTRIYGSELLRDRKDNLSPAQTMVPLLTCTQALTQDGAFWSGDVEGVWVATRQAVCSQKVLDYLLENEPDLGHVLIIVDEGHHHEKSTLGGKFCDAVTKLGGAVILLTGTPWHRNGSLTTDDSAEIHYPNSRWAQVTDEKGRRYAPRHWRLEHERIEECETDDLDLVVDNGLTSTATYTTKYRKAIINRIVARYVADGCPKVVINVPRVEHWVAELVAALNNSAKVRAALKAQGRPSIRVVDFTGTDKERIAEIEATMASESELTRYAASKIDVVIACARMNEGTDWPLCSHVYNVRIPGSLSLILQRWSRASRPKVKVTDYPEAHADAQTLVFFSPTVTGKAVTDYWVSCRNMACATVAMLEDYKTAMEYVNVCPAMERYAAAVKDGKVTDSLRDDALDEDEHDQAWSGSERNRAEAMGALLEVIERCGGEMSAKEIAATIKVKAKGDKKFEDELTQAALTRLEHVNPKIADFIRERRERSRLGARIGMRDGYGSDLVRSNMRGTWDAVVERFPDVMLSMPDAVDQMAKLTALTAAQMVERLREGLGVYLGNTLEDASLLVLEHGQLFKDQFQRWPSADSGLCTTLPGTPTWSSINSVLRQFSSCLPHVFKGYTGRGYPWPASLAELEALALKHSQMHHTKESVWPTSESGSITTLEGKPTWCALSIALRRRGSSLQRAQGREQSAESTAREVEDFLTEHNRLPASGKGASTPEEDKLAARLTWLRKKRPDLCGGLPPADRSASARKAIGAKQWTTLAAWMTDFVRTMVLPGSKDLLNHAHIKPSRSRGLGYAPDLCQVTTPTRAKRELQHDCWRFTLKGAHKPDRRSWAALLASGDNKLIETAERVAYLDWENPDKNAVETRGSQRSPSSLATRRPWSPPVAKAS